MRMFVVTGHKIDFINRLYMLFEPQVFASVEAAHACVMERINIERELLGGNLLCADTPFGSVDCDYELNDHEGHLVLVKLREMEI